MVNMKQRRIAMASLAAIILCLAFPPFEIHLQGGIVSNLGYAFIFNPPQWRDLVGSVNVAVLVSEWLVVAIVGVTLCWLNKEPPTEAGPR